MKPGTCRLPARRPSWKWVVANRAECRSTISRSLPPKSAPHCDARRAPGFERGALHVAARAKALRLRRAYRVASIVAERCSWSPLQGEVNARVRSAGREATVSNADPNASNPRCRLCGKPIIWPGLCYTCATGLPRLLTRHTANPESSQSRAPQTATQPGASE
jgi:hypothetical protein